MDWDAGTWRYRSNDSVVEVIEDDYVVSNLGGNESFVLVFFREIEEGNNSSDIDIEYFFIGVSAISPLFFRIWGICRCLL